MIAVRANGVFSTPPTAPHSPHSARPAPCTPGETTQGEQALPSTGARIG